MRFAPAQFSRAERLEAKLREAGVAPDGAALLAQRQDVIAQEPSAMTRHPGHQRRLARAGPSCKCQTAAAERNAAGMQWLEAILQQEKCADRAAQNFFHGAGREVAEKKAGHFAVPGIEIKRPGVRPEEAMTSL